VKEFVVGASYGNGGPGRGDGTNGFPGNGGALVIFENTGT
jgi:hypothetical protein